MIDLRSDTVTTPSPKMRAAMLAAEVGDDVLDGDPTTKRLEQRVAELMGMQAALFFPSGTQANQTAIWVLSEPGTEIVLEANAHLIDYELAALGALAGVQARPVATRDGLLTRDAVRAAWRHPSPFLPRTTVMAAENTHNASGGKVMPVAVWDGLVAEAREREVGIHLDGARLWHAAVALDVPPARLARGADTVMVAFSKGLGCPVGSCLAGSAGLMGRAWEVRKRLGGGMRQTGILAAAALYALDHHFERLGEDHAKAALFAELVGEHNAIDAVPPETNIVMLDLPDPRVSAEALVPALEAAGVRLVHMGSGRLRAVMHLDVSHDDVRRAAALVLEVLESAAH